MAQKFSNNAVAAISSAVNNSSDFSFSVASGQGALFPDTTGGHVFWVTLKKASGVREIWKITNRTGDVLSAGSTGNRAQQGTSLQSFVAGDFAEATWTRDDAELTRATSDSPSISSLVALTPAADRLAYYTSGTGAALATLTAFARSLLGGVDAAAVRSTLGVVAGGGGDIWVEKAGDTMTGPLTVTIASGSSGAIRADVDHSSAANAIDGRAGSNGTSLGVIGYATGETVYGILGYNNAGDPHAFYGIGKAYSSGAILGGSSITAGLHLQSNNGVVFLNSAQTRWLQWSSDSYSLPNAGLTVGGHVSAIGAGGFISNNAPGITSLGAPTGHILSGGFYLNSGANWFGQYVSNAHWSQVATIGEGVTYDVYSNTGRGLYQLINGGGTHAFVFYCSEYGGTIALNAGWQTNVRVCRYVLQDVANDSGQLYKIT